MSEWNSSIQPLLYEISSISSDLDSNKRMKQVANLIQSYFNLYAVNLFLIDSNANIIVLQASSGENSKQMISSGWRLPLGGQHPWGNAIKFNEIRLNNWKKQEALGCSLPQNIEPNFTPSLQPRNEFFFSPLLPNMVWQLLIPFPAEGKTIGVLEIVSDDPDKGFSLQTIIESLLVVNRIAIKLQE